MKLKLKSPTLFQEKRIPPDASLAGMSALIQALDVEAPIRTPTCVSLRRIKGGIKESDEWRIFDSKYTAGDTVKSHLVFALRHEHLDLLVLKRIFLALPEAEITSYIKAAPTGPIVRRIWFLYEFLTGKVLNIPDCGKVTNVDLLDSKQYFVADAIVSHRHKVRNNLLGTANFCPIVRRTETLKNFVSKQLSARAQSILEKVSPVLVARAASFLLLADTRASFAIEGEHLPITTKERWLRAVQQAGRYPLAVDELHRLHTILMGDYRFSKPGLRDDHVFLGRRTPDNEPSPEFIGARFQDLSQLMQGMVESNAIMSESSVDAVVQAAAIAFGFVYIHPYGDGNGRLHRCLIHHTLAERKFSPPGLLFPVSSVMLRLINTYKQVLQEHSAPLMPYIRWTPTTRGNVQVNNDTGDLYRFFDATGAAEFLYRCVDETIENDVPFELDYLKRHDKAMIDITNTVEMPNRIAEDFIMFMRQNQWTLPKRRRQNEFNKLTDKEVGTLETIVKEAFDGFNT